MKYNPDTVLDPNEVMSPTKVPVIDNMYKVNRHIHFLIKVAEKTEGMEVGEVALRESCLTMATVIGSEETVLGTLSRA